MTRTEHIAQFVYNLKYKDLPAEVVEAAKNMIMDTLSVAVGTTHVNPGDAKAIWETVEHYGGNPTATAIVTGKKMPAGFAAMANSTSESTASGDIPASSPSRTASSACSAR